MLIIHKFILLIFLLLQNKIHFLIIAKFCIPHAKFKIKEKK